MPKSALTDMKSWALDLMAGRLTAAECEVRLRDFKRYRELLPRDRDHWDEEIRRLKNWMASDEFKNREYPLGLDTYMLAMTELRALFFAVQTTENANAVFQKRFLFQCLSGLSHEVITHFFKLTEKSASSRSLRHVWLKASPQMIADGAVTAAEANRISDWFSNALNNANSKLYRFRNKVMAHNEHCFEVTWNDFDRELRCLARAWSLLTQWCSNGEINPWRTADEAFEGIELLVNPSVRDELRKNRQEFLDLFTDWCKRNLVSGELEKRGPFAEIRFGLAEAATEAR